MRRSRPGAGGIEGPILLTGGAGFIGSHLARALLDAGVDVDVADDLSTGRRTNLPSGARFLELDLSRPECIDALPDRPYHAIAHLAGQSSNERSFDDPLRDLDGNVRSTLLLADWALRRGIPALVHASSMGVYGEPPTHPVAEDAPARPLSWYGASKAAAERLLAVAAREGLRTCSMRMFNVYGPGQNLGDSKQGMVSIYLAYLLAEEPVTVKGSLDRQRDLVFVDDVVAAWMDALAADVEGPLNLGTGEAVTVRDLLAEIVSTFGAASDYPIVEAEGTPGDQFAISADTSRIRDELDWRPTVGWRDGVARMVDWARDLNASAG